MVQSTCASDAERRRAIAQDPYLDTMYETAYARLNELTPTLESRHTVELGSGLALAREYGYRWIQSDIEHHDVLDVINAAEHLPCRSDSLDALVLKDTWHHIPDIESFLAEAHRVLRPGGVVAVFDPYWGPLARFVYRFLHQERWDARTKRWSFASTNPWDSNQALSYIMLKRDRERFNREWGERFTVIESRAVVGPSFLLSGGVSRRTRISGRLLRRLLAWEEQRGRWFDIFRFFHTFGLVKR